jgi:hypothetical protein
MRTLPTLALALATLLTFSACKKDTARTESCEALKAGILTNDINLVDQEFEKLLAPYVPNPTAQDTYGHKANIENLVAQLNGECGFTARMDCYNCIKTLPPQSEIHLTVTDGFTSVQQVIDLSYGSNKRLIFSNMHD